jgi:hypothetical protein
MSIKIQTVFKGIRMDEVLAANCEAAAARAHVPFSKWVRQVLRRAVGQKK